MAVERSGGRRAWSRAMPITSRSRFRAIWCWPSSIFANKGRERVIRIGHGYDVHPLVAGRALILGGVSIPHDKGLAGYSDGMR